MAGLFQHLQYNRKIATFSTATLASTVLGSYSVSNFSTIKRRDFVKMTGFALGISLATLSGHENKQSAYAQDQAITVFTGGKILTVDKTFSEAEALAIKGNRILAVGTQADVLKAAGSNAKVIDLADKVVLPGFIDAHSHPLMTSVFDNLMEFVGVSRFQTAAEVLDHLRTIATQTPSGEWITARTYDPTLQPGFDALTITELDAISTQHPIFVINASGHIAYVNSKAFQAAKIPPDVQNPPGSEFVRDVNGKLNGIIKGAAWFQVISKNPALANANPVETLISSLQKINQQGFTTHGDLGLGNLTQGINDFNLMMQAAETGRLTARIRAYPHYTWEQVWDEAKIKPGMGNEMIRMVGVKLIADGSNQGFTGLQREPYLNSDDTGLAYTEPEELKRLAIKYSTQGWQLAIHGNGDKAIDRVLDALEAARDAGADLNKIRPRIEHCSILHDDQITRMQDLGVAASFLIGHVHYWGIVFRDNVFGEAKAQLLDRCRSAEAAGLSFTLHSDWAVTEPESLRMIYMAVTRCTLTEPDYVLAPEERISVESAIRALTSEAAWQLHSEQEIGSLEMGKLADFVVLGKDPRQVETDKIKDIPVLETWMDGKQVFKA